MPPVVDPDIPFRSLRNPLSGGVLGADVRRVLAHYWRVAGARPAHFAVPGLLVLVAVGFEAASLSLIVPLSEALSRNSFDFLESSRVFGFIPGLLPDAALSSPNRDAYLVLAVLALAVLARGGKLLATLAGDAYRTRRDEAYNARVQEQTFARILSFGRQYFERESLGRHDVELGWSRSVVHVAVTVELFLKNVLTALAKATVMFVLSPPLFLSVAIGFPLILKGMARISRRIETLAQESAAVEVRDKRQVLDLLGAVALVKALGQEAEARSAYADLLDHGRRVKVRQRDVRALRGPLEEMLLLTSVLAVQAALILASDGFVPGDLARLVGFLLLVQQILPDLKSFGVLHMELAAARPRLKALAGLLSDEGKFVVSSGDRPFEGLRQGIEVRDLSFSYADGTPALKRVSAWIPRGRFTALVGASGAGKTTFADVVARAYDCPPGTLFFDGVDAQGLSLASLSRRMTSVHQDIWLLNRTLRENLVYGLDEAPPDAELLEVLDDVHLRAPLAEHGSPLDLVLGDRGVQLSGGQRQRVALARALLRRPEILILDEATSALDSAVERRVTEVIRRRLPASTLLVIAHRLSTLRAADQILVLEGGRIVESGGWAELLEAGGEFHRLWAAQFEGDGVPA